MENQDEGFSTWISWDLCKWKHFYKNFSLKFYPKKSIIFHQGNSYDVFFIIAKGRARITSFSAEGNEKQIYIAEAGTICNESSSILNQPLISTAIAITDCEVYEIPISHIIATLKEDWETNMELIKFISSKNILISHLITELTFSQSLQRVARTLVNLCAQYGTPSKNGIKINIKFTCQDVAGMISATRVTVNNLFKLLMDKEILQREDGYYVIVNIKKLKELSNL